MFDDPLYSEFADVTAEDLPVLMSRMRTARFLDWKVFAGGSVNRAVIRIENSMHCKDDNHNQTSSNGPSPFPRDLIAYSTTRVVSLGRPILAVAHDHHDEWQVLHGDLEPDDEIAQICMACAVKRDPSLVQLSDLPVGWIATRKSRHKQWKREQLEKPCDPIWVRVLSFLIGMLRRSNGKK